LFLNDLNHQYYISPPDVAACLSVDKTGTVAKRSPVFRKIQ
jgi:hypothetical protein